MQRQYGESDARQLAAGRQQGKTSTHTHMNFERPTQTVGGAHRNRQIVGFDLFPFWWGI